MTYQVINGNNIEVLKTFPDNHFDSIVTDPPYGIDFLGKDWDANTGALETYQECLRVLKPGGHILAFSAARTYHHLAITLEQAGFEIRDQIMWIYSSGFPKSHDIGRKIQKKFGVKETKTIVQHDLRGKDGLVQKKGQVDIEQVVPTDALAKEWEGWGNALKPAHEPICMARKPMKSSILQNVQDWGTGAININACRIGDDIMPVGAHTQTPNLFNPNKKSAYAEETRTGRYPANVIGEIKGYEKFFYCPKVSRKERHIGFDLTTIPTNPEGMLDHAYKQNDEFAGKNYQAVKNETLKTGNNHPTVKPVELMKYLVKLVTPKGGTVLDPFNGSGSTGMACVELNFNYVGIDLDSNYVDISVKRIEAHDKKYSLNRELFVIE
jgi:site-specific DNA-methyltransferase (adenine-specific)